MNTVTSLNLFKAPVITKTPDNFWESYKGDMDYIFYQQKGGIKECPAMTELHEGIEDMSEYWVYEGCSEKFRVASAEAICQELKIYTDKSQKRPTNVGVSKDWDADKCKKYAQLWLKCAGIVHKFPTAAYHYFD